MSAEHAIARGKGMTMDYAGLVAFLVDVLIAYLIQKGLENLAKGGG